MNLWLAFALRAGVTLGIIVVLLLLLDMIARSLGKMKPGIFLKSLVALGVALFVFAVLFVIVSEYLHAKYEIPLALPF